MGVIFHVINYNLILYIGLFLIVGSFILFILNEIDKRKKDIELFKQQQLSKSFEKGKQNEKIS